MANERDTSGGTTSFNCRVTADILAALHGCAEVRKISMIRFVRFVLEGIFDWFGLPAGISEVLEWDRKRRKFDTDTSSVDYILELLRERASAVREEFERERGATAKDKARPR